VDVEELITRRNLRLSHGPTAHHKGHKGTKTQRN
jgi:hypothetical protein